jgi:hypothetical protein
MARPRIAADKAKAIKGAVAQIKNVGAKPFTGPGASKINKAASSRIIGATKQAQGKKK